MREDVILAAIRPHAFHYYPGPGPFSGVTTHPELHGRNQSSALLPASLNGVCTAAVDPDRPPCKAQPSRGTSLILCLRTNDSHCTGIKSELPWGPSRSRRHRRL